LDAHRDSVGVQEDSSPERLLELARDRLSYADGSNSGAGRYVPSGGDRVADDERRGFNEFSAMKIGQHTAERWEVDRPVVQVNEGHFTS
jgi:hypothetical protein